MLNVVLTATAALNMTGREATKSWEIPVKLPDEQNKSKRTKRAAWFTSTISPALSVQESCLISSASDYAFFKKKGGNLARSRYFKQPPYSFSRQIPAQKRFCLLFRPIQSHQTWSQSDEFPLTAVTAYIKYEEKRWRSSYDGSQELRLMIETSLNNNFDRYKLFDGWWTTTHWKKLFIFFLYFILRHLINKPNATKNLF